MKKILFSLCLIITLFCSCEPGVEDPKNPLIGSWELVEWKHVYGTGDETEVSSHKYVYGCEADYYPYLIFAENGTATAIYIYDIYEEPDFYQLSYSKNDKNISICEEDEEESFTTNFNIVRLTDKELVISIKEDWHNGDSETIYYYKKKDFVKKSVNEVVLGEWELSYWETYDLDNNEMLESGVEVPDEDWFTSLYIKDNTCEIGFGGQKVEVQYTIINNSLVFIVGDNNYSLTLPIVSLSGKRLTISKDEEFYKENEDGFGDYINGQILLYYNKK